MFKFNAEKLFCALVFAAGVALNLWFSSVGWKNNLSEGHEFRQTQTALTSYYFQKEGWQLAYPLPLFGPPWSAPLEFPLYQAAAAGLSSLTHLALEPAGRIVSLAFFYLSLPAFFLLLRHLGLEPHRRWLFLGLLLVSPAYLYYSRSFMIESTALCAAAWFLCAFCRALEDPRPRWIVAAALAGGLAAAVKITTFAVFLVPAAWFAGMQLWRARAAGRKKVQALLGAALGAILPAILAGYAWVRYGDTVKTHSPLGEFLLSGNLHRWTYGTLAQRMSAGFWDTLLATTMSSTLTAANLFFFVIFALVGGRAWRLKAWLLVACFLAGPLALANLFLIHDYYYYSTGVFLLAGLTLAWCELLDLPAFSRTGKWIAVVLCLGMQVYEFTHSYYRLQLPPRPETPELSRVIEAVTGKDDVVLIYGLDWNPVIPYYAHRKAIMVTQQYMDDHVRRNAVIGRLPAGRVTAMVAFGDARGHTEFFRLLAHSLQMGDAPLLTSANAQVFVADRLAANAAKIIPPLNLREFTLGAPAPAASGSVMLRRYVVAKLTDQSSFDMMSPSPVEVAVPFGIAAAIVDGRRVFNAHAPTEIDFEIPPAARTLHAAYGVLPSAYEKANSFEGMQFLVELIRSDGTRTTLFEQFLNPSRLAEDRGTHHLDVSVPAGAQGRIVLSSLPGPSGNIAFNWGYWGDISLK